MVLAGHGSTITSVAFSASGDRLLSTSSAGEVFEWTVGNDAAAERATVLSDFSPDVRFGLADSSIMVIVGSNGIKTLDSVTGEGLDLWPRPQQTTITVGAPGRLFSGALSGEIVEWDVATGSIVQVLSPRSSPEVMAFDKSTDRLVVGELDGTVSVWDVRLGQRLFNFPSHPTLFSVSTSTPQATGLQALTARRCRSEYSVSRN